MAAPQQRPRGRVRRRFRLVAAGAATLLVLLLAAAPTIASWVASAWATAAIRQSLREAGVLDSADIAVRCRFSWFETQRAEIAVAHSAAEAAGRLALECTGEVRRSAWSMLFASGPLPLEFTIDGEAMGPLAGDVLDRLLAAGDSPEPTRGSPPSVAARGSRWAVEARGTASLRFLDETRGIDLALRSDRIEVDAEQGAAILIDAAIGRVEEWPDLPGRVRAEAAVGDLADAWADPAAAVARTVASLEARGLAVGWQGRTIELQEAIASLRGDGDAVSLGVRLEARIDGGIAAATADLSMPAAAGRLDSLPLALAAIHGNLAVAGVPREVVAAWLPASAGLAMQDLGETIEATLTLPPEADASVVATVRLPHLEASAEAVLDRVRRSLSAGRIRISATPSSAMLSAFAPEMEAGPEVRVRVQAEGEGIGLGSDGRWRIENGRLEVSDPIPLLAAAAPSLGIGGDAASVLLEIAAAEGAASGDLGAISGRIRLASDGGWRLRPRPDRPMIEVADATLEAFAEPLGESLSLRGTALVDGAAFSIEQRIEGLLPSGRMPPLHRLRPHGRVELAGLSPARLEAWIPEAAAEFERLALSPIRLVLVTRAEGDRLAGSLRIEGGTATVELGMGLDSQRVLVGPGRLDATLSAARLAGLVDGVAVLGDLPLRAELSPLALAPLPWPAFPPLPRVEGTVQVEQISLGIESERVPSPGERIDLAAFRTAIGWSPEAARIEFEGGAEAAANGRRVGPLSWKGEARTSEGRTDAAGVRGSLELAAPRLDPAALPILPESIRPALEMLLGREASLSTRVRWEGASADGTIEADSDRLQLRASMAASGWGGGGLGAIEAAIESFEASIPPEAIGPFLDAAGLAKERRIELIGPLQISGAASAWRWSSAGGLEPGELAFTTAAVPVRFAGSSGTRPQSIPAVSITVAEAAVRGTTAIEIASIGSDALRGSIRWRRGEEAGSSGRLGGTLAAAEIPTAVFALLIDDGGLLQAALGESLSISLEGEGLGGGEGRLAAAVRSPFGQLDLPQLQLAAGSATVPQDRPLQATLAFRPELRRSLLARLNPIFADVERTDGPLRLVFFAERLPLDGDRSKLDADLRLECGPVRIQPGLALSLPLAFAGDASADGFDGLVEPLVATIRGGILRYDDFTMRFVRSGGSWRQTLAFSGSIDLTRTPPYAEAITTTYPGSNLAKFSSDLRRLPPELLETLSIPVTFYGPMGEGERLQHRIDLDPGDLLRRGAEAAIPGLIDRFLRPR